MSCVNVMLVVAAWIGAGAAPHAQELVFVVEGGSAGAAFGTSLALLPDVDGDGRLDLLVGAPFAALAAGPLDGGFQGRASVHSGADGALLLEAHGQQASELYGWSVASPGDVDHDGIADLAVGAPNWDGWRGRVQVLSGASGALLLQAAGDSAGDRFGWSLAAAGDLDGDGVPDLAVGAFDDSQPLPGSGSVRVLSLASGATLLELGGLQAHDHLGASLAAPGDADLDGVPDLAAGGVLIDAQHEDTGGVSVRSGATGAELWLVTGTYEGEAFGHALAVPGDVDGDGVADLLVGAPLVDSFGTDGGRAVLLSGASGGELLALPPPFAFGQFGSSVSGAGDVDGDGVPDLACGAPLAGDPALAGPGAVAVFSGAGGALLCNWEGTGTLSGFGAALAAGDVDDDGALDLLVGAPWDGAPASPGFVRLYSGDAWVDVGPALAGTHGEPQIAAQGVAAEGQPVGLQLAAALPGAPCVLLIGSQPLLAGLLGGTLVPDPLWASPTLPVGATGALDLSGNWPPGAPAGASFWFQWWIADPGAVQGWAATEGLVVVVG
jgi:hypothetical protein